MNMETNGRDNNSPKARPTSMDEIWGFKVAKFPTNKEPEYVSRLKKMNKADLQNECLRIHEVPHDERARMEDKLLKQFRRWVSANQTSNIQATPPPSADKAARARRILADLTGMPMVGLE